MHFGEGVGVVGAMGSGDAGVESVDSLGGAAEFGQGLGGHLVSRHIVGVVLDAEGEGLEGGFSVVLAEVLHGDAVAREGVGGVEGKNFVESGDLIHEFDVRPDGSIEWRDERRDFEADSGGVAIGA